MEFSQQNVKRWVLRVLPIVLGAAGGYAYYYFIGCVSGGCPITSDPLISTGYGALLGFFLSPAAASLFPAKNEKE